MTHIDKNIDTKTDIKETNERRVNQLIDLVEKHTRTERHLEQHSDIAELSQIRHAVELQNSRENEISHLKDLIINGHGNEHELENLQKHYHYTNNYLKHHQYHMEEDTLKNTIKKQSNRENQMKNLR